MAVGGEARDVGIIYTSCSARDRAFAGQLSENRTLQACIVPTGFKRAYCVILHLPDYHIKPQCSGSELLQAQKKRRLSLRGRYAQLFA